MKKPPSLVKKMHDYSVKIDTNANQLHELREYLVDTLNGHPLIVEGVIITPINALFFNQLYQIIRKFERKLNGVTTIRSIRLNYYELTSIHYWYMITSNDNYLVTYPIIQPLIKQLDQSKLDFNSMHQLF